MIRDYRTELNGRFIVAVEFLIKEGFFEWKLTRLAGAGKLSKIIFGDSRVTQRLYRILYGKYLIDYNQAMRFCDHYKISKDYLILGMGNVRYDTGRRIIKVNDEKRKFRKDLNDFQNKIKKISFELNSIIDTPLG